MKDTLAELESTYKRLLEVLSAIPADKVNTVPFEGSWTAAQVTEHLLKAIGIEALYGKTQPTDRDPAEKIKATSDLFLNMDIKCNRLILFIRQIKSMRNKNCWI